jgi:hypothetical protein
MTRYVMTVLAVTLAWPVAAAAQGSGSMAAVAPVAPSQAGGGGRGGQVMAGAVEAKITTGRPYSAEAVTERVQVLGDGNKISSRSTTKIYRDGEGRTRREMYSTDGTLRSISISDPVARVSYTLDPAKKVAFKTGGNVVAPSVAPAGGVGFSGGPGETRVFSTQPATAPVAAAGGGGGERVMMRSPAPDNPNVQKEDLGTQNLEGVSATGSRTTTVIPAGEIGNAQEIRVVSEQWFSDDIQALVMTRHADPRSGENIYRLRNILRAEPDPSLFQVPADYTVQERAIRRPQ